MEKYLYLEFILGKVFFYIRIRDNTKLGGGIGKMRKVIGEGFGRKGFWREIMVFNKYRLEER